MHIGTIAPPTTLVLSNPTYGTGADQLPGTGTGGPCPGSPGCPGYVAPDVNAAIQAALQAQADQQAADAAAAQSQGSANTGGQVKAPGQWIQGVSNSTVLIGGSIIAGVMFLGGRRR